MDIGIRHVRTAGKIGRQQRLSGWSVFLLAGLLTCSGCLPFGSKEPDKVAMPPYIPIPPEKTAAGPMEALLPPGMIDMYSDLLDPADTSHHPELREAVYQAIERGVLQPKSLEDRFEPQQTISFDEFRKWVAAYQKAPLPTVNPAFSGNWPSSETASTGTSVTTTATSGTGPSYEMKATSENRPTANSSGKFSQVEVKMGGPRELVPNHSGPAKTSSKSLNTAPVKPLPPKVTWGQTELSGKIPMTREMLVALYVMLSEQESKARAMHMEEIETPEEKGPITKALEQVRDAEAVSGWAKQYVALAVSENTLPKIFNLNADSLKNESGLRPQQIVTREEALMLLHHLYGSKEKRMREGQSRPMAPGLTPQNPSRLAPMIHVPPEN